MKVPFRIKRVPELHPATALLLPGHDAGALTSLCARLRLDPPPSVFVLADGFLIRTGRPLTEPVAGTVRLREIGTNLLLPVDAELVPALLTDEAAALGRQRGLVFLPESRVLEFAPNAPVPWSEILQHARLLATRWSPLPVAVSLAENLTEIEFERPELEPDDLLEPGGEGIGEEEPRPDDASLPKKMLGRGAMGVGKGLAWLGKLLHMRSLARAGAKAMNAGLSAFPRLSEKLLGKQQAALRELLQQFRRGEVDKALRHALPLSQDAGRGATPFTGTRWATNDIRYALANILGTPGPSSFWPGDNEVYWELVQEYRRQAEAATKRGDFRRAAFIYGKLLGDYRMAAAVLARGGLHADAAVLYLKVVKDLPAAARELELAGDLDRALQLYRQTSDHIHAAELLRRMGEEELALAEYRRAADLILQNGQGHYQAGELMRQKAGRPDLACEYYRAGWELRPAPPAVACARELARLQVEAGEKAALLNLVHEAADCYAAPGHDVDAGEFFNEIAHVARQPALADIRDELHDRALVMLARKLRQNAAHVPRSAQLLSQMFPPGDTWAGNLVSDAGYAIRSADLVQRRRSETGTGLASGPEETVHSITAVNVKMLVQGVIPLVRAVCQAAQSETIVLGFETGEIARFDASSGRVDYPATQDGRILDLVTNRDGSVVIALTKVGDADESYLSCLSTMLAGHRVQSPLKLAPAGRWLLPSQLRWPDARLGLWDDEERILKWVEAASLTPEDELALPEFFPRVILHLGASPRLLLMFDGQDMLYTNLDDKDGCYVRVPCPFPRLPPDSPLLAPPLSFLHVGAYSFEIAGLGEGGSLCWLELGFREGFAPPPLHSVPGPFRAAALFRPGRIAAVDSTSIVYLRVSSTGIKEQFRHPCSLPDAIACFVSQRTQELIVVSSNGSLTRVRLPE